MSTYNRVVAADETTNSLAPAVRARLATEMADDTSEVGASLSGTFVKYAPAPSGGDDQAAIQTVLDAASPGDTVMLHPGTYLVNLAAHPVTATYSCALAIPSGVRLVGAGMGATTIKLIANQTLGVSNTNGPAIIYNRTLTGGDEDIWIQDLTVDGNGANQTLLQNGIIFVRTRGGGCTRVRVKNVKGTTNFPPNETMHFDTQLGMDTSYTDCEAVGTAGTQGSGFSCNRATLVRYTGCTARGMSAGMGFTNWASQLVSHVNCYAYENYSNGFNSEEGQDVSYTGCHAGGEIAAGGDYYVAGTSLGNTGSGFAINGTKNAVLTSCVSRKNQTGISLVEGTNGAAGRINTCVFNDNTTSGVNANTAATLLRWFIDASTVCEGNTVAAYSLPTGYNTGPGAQISTAPTVPATTVSLVNPYPFRVSVYILTGQPTSLLRVNGADLNTSTEHIILDPGMDIAFWYSTAPTWIWFAL